MSALARIRLRDLIDKMERASGRPRAYILGALHLTWSTIAEDPEYPADARDRFAEEFAIVDELHADRLADEAQ